jgi:hypothetical protein
MNRIAVVNFLAIVTSSSDVCHAKHNDRTGKMFRAGLFEIYFGAAVTSLGTDLPTLAACFFLLTTRPGRPWIVSRSLSANGCGRVVGDRCTVSMSSDPAIAMMAILPGNHAAPREVALSPSQLGRSVGCA